MRSFSCWVAAALQLVHHLGPATAAAVHHHGNHTGRIAPKAFIISMFEPETDGWMTSMVESGTGNLTDIKIDVPGLSMLYPQVACTADKSVCQLTAGESEINAAASIMALVLSHKFDLRQTYFVVGGIAGVNPKYSTLGGVALSRYVIQVALQYELDAREKPDNFSTGYFAYGTKGPNQYPSTIYGTEVFEVNEALRDVAYKFAQKAKLADSAAGAEYRAKYKEAGAAYVAATEGPSVVKCDTATSDVYYSGTLLSEAFETVTRVWTNGTGDYCMSAQEDNAVLEVLVRGAIQGLVDFGRVIVMRTGSDFDRPPPNVTSYQHLMTDQNGFEIATTNLGRAGVEIVRGILQGWEHTFRKGIKPTNYIGDIFGSLGGQPNFGPGSQTNGTGYAAAPKQARAQLRARGYRGPSVVRRRI
ncbi:purine nucleoside permease-domain-containing protein [Neurospora hispaniola]|uniref:Purine nucleoside permease-domain-containing protein n=1 Tax=Neurospora hispaniola TaxID=588809 RepID=A0AAJ0I128_9PEZI|nr:purine nucleoside permease-domain-containing protein [Neurospora hispaniola]